VIPGLGAQYLLSGDAGMTSGLQVEVLTSASAVRYWASSPDMTAKGKWREMPT
jgi:hypothetical protein